MDPAWAVAIVAALGIIVPEVGRRYERRHQHRLSRADRLYAQRLVLYNDVARGFELVRMNVERTHPLLGPLPPPGEGLSDDEATSLYARLQVGAAPAVIAAAHELGDRRRSFAGAVMVFEGVQDAAGQQRIDARREMDDARRQFHESLDALEAAMRADLDSLG